jgi:hypothetical protein
MREVFGKRNRLVFFEVRVAAEKEQYSSLSASNKTSFGAHLP